MSLAQELLSYQKIHSFDEVVLTFMNKVIDECVLSKFGSPVYKAIWTLNDGTEVLLENDFFKNV